MGHFTAAVSSVYHGLQREEGIQVTNVELIENCVLLYKYRKCHEKN